MSYAKELEAFLLVLRTVPVVGQHEGQRGPDAMLRLKQVDPESARRILDQYEQML